MSDAESLRQDAADETPHARSCGPCLTGLHCTADDQDTRDD